MRATDGQLRRAVVTDSYEPNLAAKVDRYLPANYEVVGTTAGGEVVIEGHDNAGWTLDGYVIPRLLSGNYGCVEVEAVGDPL